MLGREPLVFEKGEKIIQFLLKSVLCCKLVLTLKLSRGLSHVGKCTFGNETLAAKLLLEVVLNIL